MNDNGLLTRIERKRRNTSTLLLQLLTQKVRFLNRSPELRLTPSCMLDLASSLESLHDPLLASHLSAIRARDAAESEVSDRDATLERAHKSGDRRRIEHAQCSLHEAQSDLTKAKAEEKESKQGLCEFASRSHRLFVVLIR